MTTIRLNIRVSKEFSDTLDMWSDRLGVTKSQFSSMCLQAGIKSVVRAFEPESALTPEVVKMVMEALRDEPVSKVGSTNRERGAEPH